MTKRELIDRKRVIDVVINKGTNWKDILNLLNTSTEIPIYTEQEIIEPYLDRLKRKMHARDNDNGGEPFNAVDRGYHLAYEHLCEEIDNLLSESEG